MNDMENFERIARGIINKSWDAYIAKCKEPVPADYDWRKYDNSPRGILTPVFIEAIASALQSQHSQHEREVEELRQGMGQACPHRPHPKHSETEFDDPEIRGQKFGEAAGINWANYTMLKAFDRIRAQQAERRAKQEGEGKR